jgi:protein dithiol oxidoreductase (disulfide-forming)
MTPLYRFLALLAGLSLSFTPAFAEEAPADASYVAGKHYDAIMPAEAPGAPGTVEVVELFWYGCPHCYEFEPYIARWLESKPADITFRRVPALFNQSWVPAARAYYVAEILGVTEKLHGAIFDGIHKQRRRLQTDEGFQALFVEQGVSAADYDGAAKSFAMEGKIKQAMNYTRATQITGVPAVIVNGKYRTSAGQAGSYEEMLKVVDWLVAKEKSAH